MTDQGQGLSHFAECSVWLKAWGTFWKGSCQSVCRCVSCEPLYKPRNLFELRFDLRSWPLDCENNSLCYSKMAFSLTINILGFIILILCVWFGFLGGVCVFVCSHSPALCSWVFLALLFPGFEDVGLKKDENSNWNLCFQPLTSACACWQLCES